MNRLHRLRTEHRQGPWLDEAPLGAALVRLKVTTSSPRESISTLPRSARTIGSDAVTTCRGGTDIMIREASTASRGTRPLRLRLAAAAALVLLGYGLAGCGDPDGGGGGGYVAEQVAG